VPCAAAAQIAQLRYGRRGDGRRIWPRELLECPIAHLVHRSGFDGGAHDAATVADACRDPALGEEDARGGATAALLPLYFLIFHVAYRRDRILAFLNPYADPKGFGFHIIQSLIAVATGGVTGLGFMEGKQKLFYLPEPHTDFIFAVTAEELGLVGAIFVVTLFAIFLWRGMRASWRTNEIFGRYLAVGITSMVVLQAFINISVVLGMMPTKGIPLPLVSYGGSSLFVTLASVGVLLNITKQAE